MSESIEDLLKKAVIHQQSGELVEAENLYQNILSQDPEYASALSYLGIVMCQRGDVLGGEQKVSQALSLEPHNPQFHHHMSIINMAQQRYDSVIEHCTKVLQFSSQKSLLADVHSKLGDVYYYKSELSEAAKHYQISLQLVSEKGSVRSKLGNVYADLGERMLDEGDYDGAIDYLKQSLVLGSVSARIHCNLGLAYADKEVFSNAIAHYKQAIALDSNNLVAYCGLGSAYKETGQPNEALEAFERAFEIDHDSVFVNEILGKMYYEEGDVELTIKRLGKSFIKNHSLESRVMMTLALPAIHYSCDTLDEFRRNLVERLDDLYESDLASEPSMTVCGIPFYLTYQCLNDCAIHTKTSEICQRIKGIENKPIVPRVIGNDKIKIGFVSLYLKQHTIGKLNRGLIAKLSRDKFDVSVISLAKHDDEISSFIKDHVDHYYELDGDIEDAAAFVKNLGFDILFYTDVGMEARSYSLALHRLAAVQCVTWGHPVTTGMDSMDYFISSEDLETNDSENHYTEKIVRLKSSPCYYYPPKIPQNFNGRSHFGLPETSNLYLIPQSLQKLHPDFDSVLGDILRRDDNGVIAVLSGLRRGWDDILLNRFKNTIGDVIDRIIFVPRQKYDGFMNLVAVSDVMLDTMYFGGGNTSYEIFMLGKPIVTFPAKFMRGRITYAMYRQMGIDDCIARSHDDYVDIAVRLVRDTNHREHVEQQILAKKSLLYEDIGFVRELESFFVSLFDVET